MDEATKKIIIDQVKVKVEELSTWRRVRYEGGRLYYELTKIKNEIADYDAEIQLFYLETLLNKSFIIQDNLPGSAPDITQDFKNRISTIISRLKIYQIKENGKLSSKDSKSIAKTKWELSHKIGLLSLIVATTVAIFGNNFYERFIKSNNEKKAVEKNPAIVNQIDSTVIVQQLPQLQNVPIIDKGLFVRYNYNDLVIGGVNITDIKVNARTISGESINILKDKNSVNMDIVQQPFIEFQYRKRYYSLEITGKHYEFFITLKEINNPTMTLKKYDEIKKDII